MKDYRKNTEQVTFTTQESIFIEVLGRWNGPMYTRSDDDLVRGILNFMMTEKLDYIRLLSSGGGSFVGIFAPEEGEKVLAYLRERKVVEVP